MGFWKRMMGEEPSLFAQRRHEGDAGEYGEFMIEFALKNHNLPGYLVAMRNLYVPYRRGSSEVDVLLLHEKGIFVFESKNYSGWIFGEDWQEKWVHLFPGKEKYDFYNPIQQNRTHIRALSSFLEVPETHFASYIVFSERCELKEVPQNGEDYSLVIRPRLLKELRRDLHRREVCFSREEIDDMAKALKSCVHAKRREKRAHRKKVSAIQSGKICPYCGSRLIRRRSRYGTFLACSAYPQCRYISEMSE